MSLNISGLSKKIETLVDTKTCYIFLILLAVSFAIRLIFLSERWINPDEGAHLYDAKFILDGKIPFVDYGSRMPVYVYTLAAFLKIFGISYVSGRFVPLISNIGIGIVLFTIGRKLFDSNRSGLVAASIYLFSPLSIIWSVVVKDEMLETLFVSLGLLFTLIFVRSKVEKYHLLFFSGIFFALAYYVRESSIAIFAAAILFMIYSSWPQKGKIVKTSITMLSGYFLVVILILLLFSNAGVSDIMDSRLNPMQTVNDPIRKIFDKSGGTQTNETRVFIHQPFYQTIDDWIWALKFDSFLILGAIIFYVHFFKSNKSSVQLSRSQFTFLSLWLLALSIFYLYYSISTSFFSPYFGEFVPVLSLILAYVIEHLISEAQKNDINRRKLAKIGLIAIIALFIYSSSLINFSFQCVWSPETVKEVSQYIMSQSNEGDVVLSGAMIWQLESNTRPFMNKTHPLGYLRGISDVRLREIEDLIETDKPKFIVLDGYTERIYLRNIKNMGQLINSSYTMKKEVYGQGYSVKIYEIK